MLDYISAEEPDERESLMSGFEDQWYRVKSKVRTRTVRLTGITEFNSTMITSVMTAPCKTVAADCLAVEALSLMQSHKITVLLVIEGQQSLIGVLHMHDLLRARVV
ncbi:MAG: CBS domain-containing protein [Pseudomonadota bacterium]